MTERVSNAIRRSPERIHDDNVPSGGGPEEVRSTRPSSTNTNGTASVRRSSSTVTRDSFESSRTGNHENLRERLARANRARELANLNTIEQQVALLHPPPSRVDQLPVRPISPEQARELQREEESREGRMAFARALERCTSSGQPAQIAWGLVRTFVAEAVRTGDPREGVRAVADRLPDVPGQLAGPVGCLAYEAGRIQLESMVRRFQQADELRDVATRYSAWEQEAVRAINQGADARAEGRRMALNLDLNNGEISEDLLRELAGDREKLEGFLRGLAERRAMLEQANRPR